MNFIEFFLIFPSLFMIHEMEEVIFMPDFISKQKNSNKFRKIFSYYTPFIFNIIVLEEFLILLIVLAISFKCQNFDFYTTIIIAYVYHIIPHIGQCILLKKYVPGIISGIITGIYCSFHIYTYSTTNYHLYLYSLITLIFIALNILFCFKILSTKYKFHR